MKTTIITLDPAAEYQTATVPWQVANMGRAYLSPSGDLIEAVALDLQVPVDPEADPPQSPTVEKAFYVLGTGVELPEGCGGGYWGSVRLEDGTHRHVWS